MKPIDVLREALDPTLRTPKCKRHQYLPYEGISTRLGDLLGSSIEWPRSRATVICERPYACPEKDCVYSFKRKDHLTRHLIRHKGEKLFECPVKNCGRKFSFKDNVARHVLMHDEENCDINAQKEFKCTEIGCEKVFKYASKLRKHMESHVKLDSVEAYCLEPGCMKPFTNEQCLRAHIQSCHQHIICEICGTKQLKKNIKRHLLIHKPYVPTAGIKCDVEGCERTFSTNSNLQKHKKAVHDEVKPFECGIPGCDKTFAFKHVRDNHMKSGIHVHTHGDFEETDEQFRSRPRGGCKRKCPPIEALMRKRIVPPNQSDSVLNQSSYFVSWANSFEADDRPRDSSTLQE